MNRLATIAIIALVTIALFACGEATPEPTDIPAPSAGGQATEAPPEPTNTPEPEPTAAPADTPVPADTPEPTATPEPEPEATEAPAATTPPEPAATAEPYPTAVPDPTATLAPAATAEPAQTAVPDPTATLAPAQTATPALPIAVDLAALGDNLLFVTYFDNRTQGWMVYDPSGTFTPDQLPIPPQASVPDESEIGALTELVSKTIYNIKVREDQTVPVNGNPFTFYAGTNPILWP